MKKSAMKKKSIVKRYFQRHWWKYVLTILLTLGIIYCDIKNPKSLAMPLIKLAMDKSQQHH